MGKAEEAGSHVEKSARLIRHTDDNNSARRRRDECNWRKEGPDAARREGGWKVEDTERRMARSLPARAGRARPRTTKIIFSLTRSWRGAGKSSGRMEIARGIGYSTGVF